MKRSLAMAAGLLILISAAFAADRDREAVDFVRTLVEKASGENGYTMALRYFQYTATTARNNPYSYILTDYGKSELEPSGLTAADKGKYLKVLSVRSGARIKKLWMANSEELLGKFPKELYDRMLKYQVDSLIAFHERKDYNTLMKKMKARSRRPGTKTLDIAGKITDWSGYRELAFWFRRGFERNDRVVFEILKELQTHYAK